MVVSMTGYGKSEVKTESITFTIEVKSVNNRYFDLNIRIPKLFYQFEDEITRIVKNKCTRGTVILIINKDSIVNLDSTPKLNIEKLNQYQTVVQELKENLDSSKEISVEHYLSFPNVLEYESEFSEDDLKKNFLNGLKIALEELNKMRNIEGANLQKDIEIRIDSVNNILATIRQNDIEFREEYKKRFKEKMQQIVSDCSLDETRLYQEVALLAEKRDISEEQVRLQSHIDLFKGYLTGRESSGKKMNFLLQEMGREINTIGSKTDNVEVNHLVVDMKSELENIREQVQNIL